MYILKIFTSTNEIIDVTELVTKISYTTSLAGQCGKLTFNLNKDPKNVLKLQMGACVAFTNDKFKIFLGYIFNVSVNENDEYSVLAYDQTRYLKNHDSINVDGLTLIQLFEKICKDNNISYAIDLSKNYYSQKMELKSHHYNDDSYFDILEQSMNEVNKSNVESTLGETGSAKFAEKSFEGNKCFIYDNFGVLTLTDINRFFKRNERFEQIDTLTYVNLNGVLIIGEQSLLTGYEYQLDIDKNTYNSLILVQDEKTDSVDSMGKKEKGSKLVYAIDDKSTIKQWGVLRKVVKVNSKFTGKNGAEITNEEEKLIAIKNYGKLLLEVENQIQKTVTLNCIGIDEVRAGTPLVVDLPTIGVKSLVYVVSCTHDYSGDEHTMSLEVTTDTFKDVV